MSTFYHKKSNINKKKMTHHSFLLNITIYVQHIQIHINYQKPLFKRERD